MRSSTMSMDVAPIRQAETGAVGAGTGVAIPVGGIRTGDILLAVVRHSGPGAAAGLDPAAFTVSNGSIQSASVSTTGYMLAIVYHRP
jgi:hypothetical protein